MEKENGILDFFNKSLMVVLQVIFFPFTILNWVINKNSDQKAHKLIDEYANNIAEDVSNHAGFSSMKKIESCKEFIYNKIYAQLNEIYQNSKKERSNLESYGALEIEINDPIKNNRLEMRGKRDLLKEFKDSQVKKKPLEAGSFNHRSRVRESQNCARSMNI